MRRRFLQMLLGMSLVAGLPACSVRRAPLRVGAGLWSGYLGLRLAGLRLQAEGTPLRMLDLPNASMVLGALRNGLLDAAALTLDETLLLLVSELPVQVLLVLDSSRGGHALVARAPLASLYELAGRRVGVETEAAGAYMLSRALDLSGISPERVDILALPADQHEAAFRGGHVDAVLTYDPVRLRLLAQGGRELFSSAQIGGEVVDLLVVRREALQQQPATLTALLQACLQARQILLETPEQALRQLGARAGLNPAELRRVLQGMHLPDLPANRALLGDGAGSLRPTLERVAALMRERSLLPAELHLPVDLLDPRYLPAVAP